MRFDGSKCWSNAGVKLVPLTVPDVTEQYVNWLNDPDVNRFLECRFISHDIATTRDFVEQCVADPATLLLAIRCVSLDDRHVGNIKLGPIDRNHGTAEVGIMIGDREAWGKGVGSGAIRILKDIAKRELALRRVTAGCYKSNVGSWKAFTKAGFHIEGERPKHFLLNGSPENLILMGYSFE
jgi:ribosomal-protein-alanine N-acetyltransferase